MNRMPFKTQVREAQRQLHTRWSLRDLRKRRPMLVCQMGKVGLSSVVSTLERMQLGRPIIHVHTLVAEHLRDAVRKHRQTTPRALDEHLIASGEILRQAVPGELECHVITLTREPIGRALSFVFEDWRKKIPEAQDSPPEELVRITRTAVDKLLSSDSPHADPSLWFDNELRTVFGIDVFSREYDVHQGYSIHAHDRHPTLVMRMEDMDASLGRALHEFLGVDEPAAVPRSNRGDDKWYAEGYGATRQAYRLAPDVLLSITSTKFFRHFYAGWEDKLMARSSKPELTAM